MRGKDMRAARASNYLSMYILCFMLDMWVALDDTALANEHVGEIGPVRLS